MATDPLNVVSSRSRRDKYRKTSFEQVLRNVLVAEKICQVDRSDVFRIQSPYSSQPTATIQGIAAGNQGTYTPGTWTLTDDTLTVTDEFILGEHIFGHEAAMMHFGVMMDRIDNHNYAIAFAIDKFVLNNLLEDATGAYSTPSGGFSAANTQTILANLSSKVMGYAPAQNGFFLVIETTDVPGFMVQQMASGFSFADSSLRNGFMTSQAGIDIYVVRPGTFVDATIGTTTVTNSGHRVFGVKNIATYAMPRGVQFEEKQVSGKTGFEIVTYGWVGFKLWAPHTALVVDITLV